MSSEIFYDRAFVQIGSLYIPLVCQGSSNTYAIVNGRELPDRRWHVLNHGCEDKLLFTKEQIVKQADLYEEISISSQAVNKSRNVRFGDGEFYRWIVNGMKSAWTLEKYDEFGNRLYISAQNRWDEKPYEASVPTEAEFLQHYQEVQKQGYKYLDLRVEDERNFTHPKCLREPAEPLEEYYVLAGNLEGDTIYFTKLRPRGIRFSYKPGIGYAKAFKSEKEALGYLKKYEGRLGYIRFTPLKISAIAAQQNSITAK